MPAVAIRESASGIDHDALTHNLARSRDLRARLRTSGADDYSSLANLPARPWLIGFPIAVVVRGHDGSTTTGITAHMIAIAPLEWPGMNQAFLTALVATLVLSLAIIPYGKRRPVGAPFSWGEAMLGSTYLFGVLFLAFGILPHQWIDHADKDLGWSKDNIIYGPGGILKPESAGGWNPITLQYEALRDIVAVLIHAVLFGLYIYLAVWWQKRGDVKPKELPTSTYGRPLVKKA
jgi:hypothetical protein